MKHAEKTHSPSHGIVRPTTIIEAPRLGKHLGVNLILASETFQHTGSFKFRAAYSVASRVPEKMLIAASSGISAKLSPMPAHSSRSLASL